MKIKSIVLMSLLVVVFMVSNVFADMSDEEINRWAEDLKKGVPIVLKEFGISCDFSLGIKEFKQCIFTYIGENPSNPKFIIHFKVYPQYELYGKFFRDRFGDKVFLGGGNSRDNLLEDRTIPKYTLTYSSNRKDIKHGVFYSSLLPCKDKTLKIEVTSETREKVFTQEVSGDNCTIATAQGTKKLLNDVCDWLEKEIDIQKKIQQKNATDAGKQ